MRQKLSMHTWVTLKLCFKFQGRWIQNEWGKSNILWESIAYHLIIIKLRETDST
jgi:hypothetical protein